MPPSDRKGSWYFETTWTFSGPRPTASIVTSGLLVEVDSALTRDLLERETLAAYLRSARLKYKLSDLEIALKRNPITLQVTGYIQSAVNRAIDHDHLLRWFTAEWSPVDGQLGRNDAYREWSQQDPAYRHVQVFGEPAVATRGPNKSKVCVFARINLSCIKAVFAALSMLF